MNNDSPSIIITWRLGSANASRPATTHPVRWSKGHYPQSSSIKIPAGPPLEGTYSGKWCSKVQACTTYPHTITSTSWSWGLCIIQNWFDTVLSLIFSNIYSFWDECRENCLSSSPTRCVKWILEELIPHDLNKDQMRSRQMTFSCELMRGRGAWGLPELLVRHSGKRRWGP